MFALPRCLSSGLLCASLLLCASPRLHADEAVAHSEFSDRPEVIVFNQAMAAKHGFAVDYLQALMARVTLKPNVLAIFERPSTGRPWFEFRPDFVNGSRVRDGVRFWQQHRDILTSVSTRYEVEPEYILAILAAETRFGRNTGSFRVLDVLATTAFDYPRRADYFREELEQFLLLAREEGGDPFDYHGSYAGALGWPQFMPSSYRRWAVDFDGDGHRDIWQNPADAVASVANYFRQHGWRQGEPVTLPVTVDASAAEPLLADKFNLHWRVVDLAQQGVTAPEGVDPQWPAVLFNLQEADGMHYHLGFNNFYVITRYNKSTLYAMAVHQLAQAIRAAYLDPGQLPAKAPGSKAKPGKRAKKAGKRRHAA